MWRKFWCRSHARARLPIVAPAKRRPVRRSLPVSLNLGLNGAQLRDPALGFGDKGECSGLVQAVETECGTTVAIDGRSLAPHWRLYVSEADIHITAAMKS